MLIIGLLLFPCLSMKMSVMGRVVRFHNSNGRGKLFRNEMKSRDYFDQLENQFEIPFQLEKTM